MVIFLIFFLYLVRQFISLVGEIEKRAITYQIAKNKGLTPYRKKDQRNPRVKHRNKFRKAKICRKGAVSFLFFIYFLLEMCYFFYLI